MNLNEFIEKLQEIADRDCGDHEVCVRMHACLSSHTGNPVTTIGIGFDWERNKIMLQTEHPAERYYTKKQREERRQKMEDLKNEHFEQRD